MDSGFTFWYIFLRMNTLEPFVSRWKTHMLFTAILLIGIFARVWEFASLPPGLNVDEASIGVEAYYLYKFGMDRFGLSYPVHFISWGSGQNSLYAYLLMPFVALKGIDAFAVRLPMMLAGILSLPLVFIAGKKLFNEKFALLAMFFMAVSPWHIVNSRWAVESNIMPFLFLAGFTTLTLADKKNLWVYVSIFFFALCLYAYGTAYVGVPVFLLLTVPYLLKLNRLTVTQVIIGAVVFILLAFPIGLFIAVNTFKLETMHLGVITIPRLPVEARYETMAAVFGETPFAAIAGNARIMFDLLWTQSDAFPWNFVEPFGYFYKVTFPLVLIGLFLAFFIKENRPGRWLIAAWMLASIIIGLVHPVNLTRLNIIFTPILLCIALLFLDLEPRLPRIIPAAVVLFSIAFLYFNRAYHSEDYRKVTSALFNEGIVPAIDYAADKSDSLICLTDEHYSLYIYVLLAQKYHPSEYVTDLEWIDPADPADPARKLVALKNFRFTPEACLSDPKAAYILTLRESPPNPGIGYKEKKFVKFVVHLPK
ncbi:MAG: glycosyltransferase family 39 protein [Anaerolineales bacterium]|nr:glycosyltransferase family 39 protein [Anaerolineales bacterium]